MIGPNDPDVGTVLASGLWSPAADVSRFCWEVLPKLPTAKTAVPAIIKRTTSSTVATHAPVLVKLCDKDNRVAIEKCLKAHAKDPDTVTRGVVADALDQIARKKAADRS